MSQSKRIEEILGRSERARRTALLGHLWQLPKHPDDAFHSVIKSTGWRQLGMDVWDRSLVFSLAFGALAIIFLVIAALWVCRAIPPQVSLIDDFRISTHYAARPITSGALGGRDWLVLGTQGLGVQAYRRDSGLRGLWRDYNSVTTQGALSNDTILRITSNSNGIWYLVGDGGVTLSSADLQSWQRMIGTRGFASITPKEITNAVLSPNKRYLAVTADKAGLGIYDTETHDWIAHIELQQPARTLEFLVDAVVVGTSNSILGFRVSENQIFMDPILTMENVSVSRFSYCGDWLLAITSKQGLVGKHLAQNSKWEWLIGETGLQVPVAKPEDVTAAFINNESLWVAVDKSIGHYIFSNHSWQTIQVDNAKIQALVEFDGTTWVGTINGLYRWSNGQWIKIDQNDGRGAIHLTVTPTRLWVVTGDGGLGYIVPNSSQWNFLISTTAFGNGITVPNITDVVTFQNEFWVSTTNLGIASYDGNLHRWTSRGMGLPSPNAVIMDLAVSNGSLWALVGDAQNTKPPYQVFFWNGLDWHQVPSTRGSQISIAGGSVWLLGENGDLLRLTEFGTTPYYQTTSFDPSRFRAVSFDAQEQVALVASDEGMFSYSLNTHSWRKVNELGIVDIASFKGHQLSVTTSGGLILDAGKTELLPSLNSQNSFGELTTATWWNQKIWASDGKRLVYYDPYAYKFIEESFIPNVTILQLRTGNSLWALGRSADKTRHLFRYNEANKTWLQIDSGKDISSFAVAGNSVFYVESENKLHQIQQNQDYSLFSGGFAGASDTSSAVQINDGTIWILSPTSGLARYDARSGSWNLSQIAKPNRMALVQDKAGSPKILVTSPRGLFLQDALVYDSLAQISNAPALDITYLNDTTYVLGNSGTQILQWTGSGVTPVFTFSPTMPITITGGIPLPDSASEIVTGSGKLWARYGSFAVGLTKQGEYLVPKDVIQLPVESNAHLVNGDNNGLLYFGTSQKCWVLQSNQWISCVRPDMLTQTTKIINDRFGRFTVQLSAISARLVGGNFIEDHFASDRARVVRLGPDNTLFIQTDGGVWSVPNGQWDNRSLSNANVNFKASTETIFSVSSEPWQWHRLDDPVTLTDQVTIVSQYRGDVKRQITGSRFSDTYATSVVAFDGKVWLGTRQGIWQFNDIESFSGRILLDKLPTESVSFIAVANNTLWVVFASGAIWHYQSGSWTPENQIPDLLVTITDESGEALFRRTPRGIITSPFTREATPRFERDKLLGIVEDQDTLWIATLAGTAQFQLNKGQIKTGFWNTDLSGENVVFLKNGDSIYVRQVRRNEVHTFQLDNKKWMQVLIEQTPFGSDIILSQHLMSTSLQWIRSKDGRIIPQMGYTGSIGWSNGRLRSDVIRTLIAVKEDFWLGTLAGVYKTSTDINKIKSFPDEILSQFEVTAIGTNSNGTIWIKDTNSRFYELSDNLNIQAQPLKNTENLNKNVVSIFDGKWQNVMAPLSSPILIYENQLGENLFGKNGRFRFDNINDAIVLGNRVILASEFGLIEYSNIPLNKVVDWNTELGKLAVQRIILRDNIMSIQTSNGAYQRTNLSRAWGILPDTSIFLPNGVVLTETGWEPSLWDKSKQELPIKIVALSQSASWFASNGKFTFDIVHELISNDDMIWILSEAGWVRAHHAKTSPGFDRFKIISGISYPPEFVSQSAYFEDNSLIVRGYMSMNHVNVNWQILGDRLSSPLISVASNEHAMKTVNYRISSDDNGEIRLETRTSPQYFSAASQWFFPFDFVKSLKVPISPVIQFLDDPNSIWIITERGLVRIDKGRLEVQ
jgi:hypothetical protein